MATAKKLRADLEQPKVSYGSISKIGNRDRFATSFTLNKKQSH